MPNLPHLENPRHLLPISSVVPLPGPMDTVSHVLLFASPWTIACQAPLSMEFFRPGYWSGLTFSSPGDLPDPEIKPASLVFPTLASDFFTPVPPEKTPAARAETPHYIRFPARLCHLPRESPCTLPQPGFSVPSTGPASSMC